MLTKLANDIPNITIGRLPIYLRALMHLQSENQHITSSHELSEHVGISSSQIRKDLSYFGGFGKQGTGYHIEFLVNQLCAVLQINNEWRVAVIGIGDLGSAISNYEGFTKRGFRICWLFDSDPKIIGQQFGGLSVLGMNDLNTVLRQNCVQIVMLAVPSEYAQVVANDVVSSGVRAIINYAPISLIVPDDVMVQYIDPIVNLQHMTYYLKVKIPDDKETKYQTILNTHQ